jgi:hypothetical protein
VAVDFSRYLPPGIYTNPVQGPQLAVNSSLPTAVGLFGAALGYRTFIESVLINPDTNSTTPSVSRTLAQKGIDKTTIQVTNPNSGQVYYLNTDFTVQNIGGVNGSSNATYAIKRVIDANSHIQPGDTIQISYQYTDPTYYTPYVFYDYQDVVAAYGPPFNTQTGAVQSELSLGAKFAFLNGAYQVVCVAVDPSTPGSPTTGDYQDALNQLQDEPLVAVVVPCTGSQPLQQLVQEHIDSQSNNRYERRAILGLDGSSAAIPTTQRVLDAQALSDSRIMLVSPSSFNYFSPELNKTVTLGGQYMAASLAGMTVAMSFAQPLTHKQIVGWNGIGESQPQGQMTNESKNGLAVIEYNRQKILRVRHGVTTDPSDLLAREWSITGQQDALVYRLRDYLDDANLIGQPIYNYTLVNVKASAEAALQSLVRDGLLVDYVGLSVRQLLTNPDVIEISFGWKPAFPLNYIVLTFSVSLMTGSVTTNSPTANRNNFTSTTQTTISTPMASSINDFGGSGNTLQSF